MCLQKATFKKPLSPLIIIISNYLLTVISQHSSNYISISRDNVDMQSTLKHSQASFWSPNVSFATAKGKGGNNKP